MTTKGRQQRGRRLLSALRNERSDRALELIVQGADTTVVTSNGETALYLALVHQCYATVGPLLQSGADPNVPGPYGAFPIHIAAEWGGDHAPFLLETLITHGARIEVRDDEGATAIFLAGKAAGARTVHTLLRYGANISDRNDSLDTALTFACCWGMTERAQMLIDAGIDVNAQDNFGRTALHWAAMNGHAATVGLLIHHGAYVNVSDTFGATPLVCAAAHGSFQSVRNLLEAGADPSVADNKGESALSAARRYAGRDLAEAMRADAVSHGRANELGVLFTERYTTSDGEPAVRIGERGNWERENVDRFDAIVALLTKP